MPRKEHAGGTQQLPLLVDTDGVGSPGSRASFPAADLHEYQRPPVEHHEVDLPIAAAGIARDEDQPFGLETEKRAAFGRSA